MRIRAKNIISLNNFFTIFLFFSFLFYFIFTSSQIFSEEEPVNLSKNKIVRASFNKPKWVAPPQFVVDGKFSSFWRAKSFPQFITIDLGDVFVIEKIIIFFSANQNNYYHYTIESSIDDNYWKLIIDEKKNTIPASKNGDVHYFPRHKARFVRLNILFNSLGKDIFIKEIETYGFPKDFKFTETEDLNDENSPNEQLNPKDENKNLVLWKNYRNVQSQKSTSKKLYFLYLYSSKTRDLNIEKLLESEDITKLIKEFTCVKVDVDVNKAPMIDFHNIYKLPALILFKKTTSGRYFEIRRLISPKSKQDLIDFISSPLPDFLSK